MGFKLVRVDANEPCKIPLQVGAYFFGRGNPTALNYLSLQCDDGRVSRRHGSMEVTADNIVIEALHVNPCFYKKKLFDTKVLSLGESIELASGDQFGLVPDCYWFEIIYCADEAPKNDITPTKEPQAETNDEGLECSPSLIDGNAIALPNTAVYQPDPRDFPTPATTASQTFTQEDAELDPEIEASFNSPLQLNESHDALDHDAGISLENTVENPVTNSQNEGQSTLIKRLREEASPDRTRCDDTGLKKVKTEPDSPEGMDAKVKTEPVSPDAAQAGPSHDQPGPSDDGAATLPAAGAPPQAAKAPPPRERCFYGANCYRKNAQHKQTYSHPSDADYGTGAEGPCPNGAGCLRVDPRHWAARAHPAGVAPPPLYVRLGRLGMRMVERHGNVYYIEAHAVHFHDDHVEVEDEDGNSVDLDYEF